MHPLRVGSTTSTELNLAGRPNTGGTLEGEKWLLADGWMDTCITAGGTSQQLGDPAQRLGGNFQDHHGIAKPAREELSPLLVGSTDQREQVPLLMMLDGVMPCLSTGAPPTNSGVESIRLFVFVVVVDGVSRPSDPEVAGFVVGHDPGLVL